MRSAFERVLLQKKETALWRFSYCENETEILWLELHLLRQQCFRRRPFTSWFMINSTLKLANKHTLFGWDLTYQKIIFRILTDPEIICVTTLFFSQSCIHALFVQYRLTIWFTKSHYSVFPLKNDGSLAHSNVVWRSQKTRFLTETGPLNSHICHGHVK